MRPLEKNISKGLNEFALKLERIKNLTDPAVSLFSSNESMGQLTSSDVGSLSTSSTHPDSHSEVEELTLRAEELKDKLDKIKCIIEETNARVKSLRVRMEQEPETIDYSQEE